MKIKKILETKRGEQYFVKDVNQDFHTKYGTIKSEDIKKAKDGDVVVSNKHEECVVYEPSFIDVYRKIKRSPQIVPLKDIGFIVAELGLGKNSIVAEGGGGSGGMACFLGSIVKKVYSFEIKPELIELIQQNLDDLELTNVELFNKSMYEGIDVKNVDAVFFDLPEPWLAVTHAKNALKVGGFLVSYSPHVTSAVDFVNTVLQDGSFSLIKTVEVIEQPWEIQGRKCRPMSERIHSGFITVVRKIKN